MLAAFEGVYLIRLSIEEWGYKNLPEFGTVDVVPIFYRMDAAGHPTGDKIDGGAWGEDTYGNIADTMGPWFQQP